MDDCRLQVISTKYKITSKKCVMDTGTATVRACARCVIDCRNCLFVCLFVCFSGYIMFGDETRTLIKQSYWASYNIP